MKLEVWLPTKPFTLTQEWGNYNTAYEQFGFTRHNGRDFAIAPDKKLRAPVRMRITNQGFYPNGAGNYVGAVTTEKWEVEGKECFVYFVFMHLERFLHNVGDILEVGDEVGVPDNTGFSTGPHTHLGAYRLNDDLSYMDTNEANGSFNWGLYCNGLYAEDCKSIVSTLATIKTKVEEIAKALSALWKS